MNMEYKQVGIPKPIFDRFEKIRSVLSYRTFSEFVVGAVRDHLNSIEWKAEKIQDEIEKARLEEEKL